MTVKRRRFSAAEKAKIALAALKGEMTMSEIVSKYSVHASQVNAWKKKALMQIPEAFSSKRKTEEKEQSEKLSELYEQIGRLKVENEFLKKKCDLFAD